MSWEVGDDEWLAEPWSVPGAGPVDNFDDQLMKSLSASFEPERAASAKNAVVSGAPEPPREPERHEIMPSLGVMLPADDHADEQTPAGMVPPPPYSAAFDPNAEAPSYETSSFVGQSPEPPAEEFGFHIPALSASGAGVAGDPVEHSRAAPLGGRAAPLGGQAVDGAQVSAADGFVIPTLSRASSPGPVVEDGFEEVEPEEVEEVEPEEFDSAPVRTGDTAIARAPEFKQDSASSANSASITQSVYDDDDDDDCGEFEPVSVIPEMLERVDSEELELLAEYEDTAVEAAPSDPDADTVVKSVPEVKLGSHASAGSASAEPGFVIPTLARVVPEHVEHVAGRPPGEGSEDTAEIDGVVIPALFAAAAEEAPAAEISEDEIDDLQEVEVDAIESLDTADLEEYEQAAAAVAPPEVKSARPEVKAAPPEVKPPPPAPPEAKPQAKRRKAWYDDVFAEHFLFLYPLTWEHTCERDAKFMFSLLGAREGMSVLDVGCGDGRHAVELAKLGARVTGVDNSLALLLAAAQTKEAAELEQGGVDFIHSDMRRLPRDRDFDAVVCIGTTLGYFEEEQNWLCLQEMHDRLLPGGRLLIHVFNRDFIAPHLPSRSWWQGKRCMVIDEAEMNFFANRLRVHRTIIFDDGRQYEHYMFMRAYTVQDLGKAVSQLGMRVVEVSGSRDTRGRFYGSASPDIWIVAEKK